MVGGKSQEHYIADNLRPLLHIESWSPEDLGAIYRKYAALFESGYYFSAPAPGFDGVSCAIQYGSKGRFDLYRAAGHYTTIFLPMSQLYPLVELKRNDILVTTLSIAFGKGGYATLQPRLRCRSPERGANGFSYSRAAN